MHGDKSNPEVAARLARFAEIWYHYCRGIFLKAYFEKAAGANLLPREKNDTELLLRIFLLEKAIYELNYELNNRPSWVGIPMRGIQALLIETPPQPVLPLPEPEEALKPVISFRVLGRPAG